MSDTVSTAATVRPDASIPGYWAFQIGGWSAFALVSILSLNVWYNPGELIPPLHSIVQAVIGVFVSHPLRWAAQRTWNFNPAPRLALNAVAILVASQIWTVLRLLAFTLMTGTVIGAEDWGGWIFGSLMVFSCWAFCYHAIRYYRQWVEQREVSIKAQNAALEAEAVAQREHIKRLEAENLVRESRLRLLNHQLNPHFFFNSLNSVTALVRRGDKDAATEMLSRIGDFLRVSIDSDDEPQHPLRDELHIVDLYVGIEKIRFGDRLVTEVEVSDDAAETLIPSLLLQPLIENCVKHAVGRSLSPTTIRLSGEVENDRLSVRVTNTSPETPTPGPAGKSRGIGLKNVEERLRSMYGDQYRFRAGEKEDGGGFEIQIDIPAQRLG